MVALGADEASQRAVHDAFGFHQLENPREVVLRTPAQIAARHHGGRLRPQCRQILGHERRVALMM